MKRVAVAFITLLALLILMVGCLPRPATDSIMILQTPVKTKEKDTRVRVSGRVMLAEPSDLSFTISGRLASLNVREGDTVEAGKELARLDASSLETEVLLAEAALAVAQAGLEKARMAAHPAQIRELEIKATTAASIPPRTGAEATQLRGDSAVAEAQLEYLLARPLPQEVAAAEADVALAEQKLEAARQRLAQAVLVAPVSGTVTKVYVHAYEYAQTGAAIVQIADLSRLYVEATVESGMIYNLQVGDVVSVVSLAGDSAPEEAFVTNMQPANFNGEADAFVLTLVFSNPSPALRWGTGVEVVLPEK